jgi:cobalt/nickel transport system permease protein
MHLSDGVLPAPIWIGGMLAAGTAAALTARRLDERRLPEVAVLTGVFFTASLVHFPLGGVAVHLGLTGLMGIILGWLSIPAVGIALALQAVLFGHGGLTTLGVNTVILASGALVARGLYRSLLAGWSPARGPRSTAAAFVASLGGSLASATIFLAVMTAAGRAAAPPGSTNPFLPVALAVLIPQLAVALVDAAVCAGAVGLLQTVQPDLLPRCRRPTCAIAVLALDPRGGSQDSPALRRFAGPVLLAAVAVGPVLGAPRPALAHALEAVVRTAAGGLEIEAFYAGGVPARGARIEVRAAAAAEPSARGVTDARGRFAFPVGRVERLIITVEDGEGHRATVEVPAAEIELLIAGKGEGGESQRVADSRGRWLSALGPPWARLLAGLAAIAALLWIVPVVIARSRGRAA